MTNSVHPHSQTYLTLKSDLASSEVKDLNHATTSGWFCTFQAQL